MWVLSEWLSLVESSWNVMAHGNAREGKWRGNWRMERVASTLHSTSEHGVSSNTTADTHTSVASSRLNWRPRRFKWIRPFRRKTKSGFCACAITFQTQSTTDLLKPVVIYAQKIWTFPRALVYGLRHKYPPVLSWNFNLSFKCKEE